MATTNILQQAYDDIGTVIPIYPEKEYNKTDYINKMSILIADLNKKFTLNINDPRSLAVSTYEECLRYDDSNSRGIVEGIYIDIGSEMIVVDSILDKASGTDAPNTSVYYVYALNLTIPDFSEQGTAFITTARDGRRKHVKQVWEQADDNITSINNKSFYSSRPPQIVFVEIDDAVNKIFDQYVSGLPNAEQGSSDRNILHKEFTYMCCYIFIRLAFERPETKQNITTAQNFAKETISILDQYFFMLPEYYGNRKEMNKRLMLYKERGTTLENLTQFFYYMIGEEVILSNDIEPEELFDIVVECFKVIKSIINK